MNGEDLIRLAIRVNKNLPDLYHISFNHDLEGMWTPVEPDGDYTEENVDLVTETVVAKISVSPTIEQCFQAIYANVKHLFGGRGRSKMTFAVYKPRFTGRERIILPKAFTEQRAIHDAHITEEHGIIDPTYMEYVGRVEIEVPKSSDKLYYYAFDDRSVREPYGWLPYPVNVIKDLPSMEAWYDW